MSRDFLFVASSLSEGSTPLSSSFLSWTNQRIFLWQQTGTLGGLVPSGWAIEEVFKLLWCQQESKQPILGRRAVVLMLEDTAAQKAIFGLSRGMQNKNILISFHSLNYVLCFSHLHPYASRSEITAAPVKQIVSTFIAWFSSSQGTAAKRNINIKQIWLPRANWVITTNCLHSETVGNIHWSIEILF